MTHQLNLCVEGSEHLSHICIRLSRTHNHYKHNHCDIQDLLNPVCRPRRFEVEQHQYGFCSIFQAERLRAHFFKPCGSPQGTLLTWGQVVVEQIPRCLETFLQPAQSCSSVSCIWMHVHMVALSGGGRLSLCDITSLTAIKAETVVRRKRARESELGIC